MHRLKRVFLTLMMFCISIYVLCGAAFADPAVPITIVSTDSWLNKIIEALAGFVLTSLIPLMALGAKAIAKAITDWEASAQGQKYATIVNLASAGVKMAETMYGPNTQRGKDKETEAVKFLMNHVPSLTAPQAQDFVQAAYADLFLIADPSSAVPAAKAS